MWLMHEVNHQIWCNILVANVHFEFQYSDYIGKKTDRQVGKAKWDFLYNTILVGNYSSLKRTLFASGVICCIIDELKGSHPLNTAPPPSVLGYSRTLANVKAPGKKKKNWICKLPQVKKTNHASASISMCACACAFATAERKRQTSLTESTHEHIIRICASSYLLIYHLMDVLNCFKETTFIFWRILKHVTI
jgi:hypothetical protein